MNADVRTLAETRGITRLCHFTQSRNLPHILDAGRVLSVTDLRTCGLPINMNDPNRLDGLEDHISCSIEYPNAWYMAQAATREQLFEDWVVLEIDPSYLWAAETLFCPVNAAKGLGGFVVSGVEGLEQLYDIGPPGSRQRRGMLHLESCPTDNQAEVLVAEPIALGDVVAVITETSEQATKERARLQLLDHSPDAFAWKSATELFDARQLAGRIQSGERPDETIEVAAPQSSS